MLEIYHYDDNKHQIRTQAKITPGSWLNVVDPTDAEIKQLKGHQIPEDFIYYGLDKDESARVEKDPDLPAVLVIFDVPVLNKNNNDSVQKYVYQTAPLGIIITPQLIVTISRQPHYFLGLFSDNQIPDFRPDNQAAALLRILYQITSIYLQYLRELNKTRESLESALQKSLRNEELYRLMGIQRSLVYFLLSLQTDRIVLDGLKRNPPLELTKDDQDLLNDILIENQQGSEMAQISNSIINETADTYSSIINNNMNGVMKFLTSYSIILTIPTLVFSFYGMNVALPLAKYPLSWIITLIISLIIAVFLIFYFWRKKYF
ncbi:Magnesium and cobalt transporter [Lactobacillus selangorensis]|uniref:Magnesium and cobalt transporter n=1 Tax=Lactobacillus selangorensis TaxID=81857 RepID=A0A0R2FUB2_9LACO|nr:magnesium transporter CorA family protein [Lactobacillus selangorensis]KRN28453.1 Magnesium and cobalt transporter [Lactobacillus selangorensis]KRN31954.1 Magnesium and cobalt transporter [Lactobacillus selangorensis]